MLVLTRKKNESIIIGDDIVITIAEIRSDKVRVAIEAPQSVQVHRMEIYQANKRQPKAGDGKQVILREEL